MINDQVLKVGDTISGFMIEEIRRDKVFLIKDKARRILQLDAQFMEK